MDAEAMTAKKDVVVLSEELLTLCWLLVKALWWTAVDAVKYFWPREPRSVHGKVVLITGASRGLGRELALQFAALGAKVVLWSSRQANVDKVAKEVVLSGGQALAYECDVSDEEQVSRVTDRVLKDVGRVDVLVNNAGVAHMVPLVDMDSKDILRMYNINLFSNFWTIKKFLPHMVEQGEGHVVSINSLSSVACMPGFSAYSGTKHALRALMDCVEQEITDANIRFTTVCPGFFESGLVTNVQNRLGMLCPVPSAEEVARTTVQAVLTDRSLIFIPASTGVFARLGRILLSKRSARLILDYVNFTFDVPHS